MKYEANEVYHIFNQGNNRQKLFFKEANYFFFLQKMVKHLTPNCHILAYCLMPNHFHWMVKVKPEGTLPSRAIIPKYAGDYDPKLPSVYSQQNMSLAVGTLLSSYTKAINIERERSGSLFRCKTKIKPISLEMDQGKYLFTCFDYIHNNPLEAGLVNNPLEYQFSSALEYAGLVDDGLCHVDIITAHFLDSA